MYKKSKVMKCPEMSLRSEELDKQLSSLIQSFFAQRLGGGIVENGKK